MISIRLGKEYITKCSHIHEMNENIQIMLHVIRKDITNIGVLERTHVIYLIINVFTNSFSSGKHRELHCVVPRANDAGVVTSMIEERMLECCMSYGTFIGGALFPNHDNDNLYRF